MYIKELVLNNFRNYSFESAVFTDGVNVIYGSNAQGKTNILEAVFYLAAGRSFRSAADKDLINLDCESSIIQAKIMSHGRGQMLEARFCRGRRRVILANDTKLKNASELSGRLTAVEFGPDDLNLIKDGAAIRRKLLDNCLSQLRPGYLAALTEFNKLYEHKTRILRDHYEKPSLLELLDDFNERLALQSARLIKYRAAFVKSLSIKATQIHKDFSGGCEDLTIKYKTVNDMPAAEMSSEDILHVLQKHQHEKFDAELKSGLCLSGSHKDDLLIDINGIPTRKFASQGQTRTASISIKLAERDIHYDNKGEYPVLLLDDVLSELDAFRRQYILSKITNGQVLITCCDEEVISDTGSSKMIHVNNGKIIRNSEL